MDIQISEDAATPLYRRLAQAVTDAIAAGRLHDGDRLPARLVLAKDLGINPMTVRHALTQLQLQGLIISKHGSGTYVAPGAADRLRQGQHRQYASIVVVVGENTLADTGRETNWIASDILTGVSEAMTPQRVHFEFVRGFDQASLGHLTRDHAVLFMKCRQADLDPAMLQVLVERGVPVLGMWGHRIDLPIPRMDYDHYQAASVAPQHLVDCGYTRIGFIGDKGSDAHAALGVKFLQFASVLHDAGLDYRASHVHNITQHVGEAYRATLRMIEQGDMPQAVVVDTDIKALEVLSALAASGVKVPDDLAVIGRDGIPEVSGTMYYPRLTTVRTPRREIGQHIGKLLQTWEPAFQRMKSIYLHAHLVKGDTTLDALVPVDPSSHAQP